MESGELFVLLSLTTNPRKHGEKSDVIVQEIGPAASFSACMRALNADLNVVFTSNSYNLAAKLDVIG